MLAMKCGSIIYLLEVEFAMLLLHQGVAREMLRFFTDV